MSSKKKKVDFNRTVLMVFYTEYDAISGKFLLRRKCFYKLVKAIKFSLSVAGSKMLSVTANEEFGDISITL